jgi:hypothetical protein
MVPDSGHPRQATTGRYQLRAAALSVQDHAAAFSGLYLRLFRHFQSVVNLNSKVPHCTFQFGMA